MTRPVSRLLTLSLLFILSVATAYCASDRPFVQRLRKEGVRLAHLAGVEGSVDAMAKAGCNTMMLQTWSLRDVKKTTPADSEDIITNSDLQPLQARLNKHADECKYANVLDFATFYGLSEVEAAILNQHKYDRLTDDQGRQTTAIPCTLSRRYWMGFILPQFLLQARTLKDTGVPGGAIIDLEHYNQEMVFAWEWEICYCDGCWAAFSRKNRQGQEAASMSVASRGQWIKERKLTGEYRKLIASRFSSLMREFAGKCRAVNPDLILGFYPYVPNWYCDTIIRSWQTPTLPVFAMSESEWFGYRTKYSEPRIRHLRSTKLNALYVSGMWQGACWPKSYGARAEELIRKTDGYWLYYSNMFFNPAAEKKLVMPHKGTEYTLAAPAREYIEALTEANRRLDMCRQSQHHTPAGK